MAKLSVMSTAILIAIVIIIINTMIVTAVRDGELNVMFGVMRARGYHLFANAIATSDIHYDLKSDGNFTLFAPINSALFAIDMTMAASNYVTTLRYHVVPRRMTISDLLSLPPASNSVPTLNSGQDIVVEQRRSLRSLITVGGVDVVVPGMFYGRDIAVHGLEGILEYRSHSRSLPANLTVTNASLSKLFGNITDLGSNSTQEPPIPFSPPISVYNITGNYTFQFPVDTQSPPQNQTVTDPMTHRIANNSSSNSNSESFELTGGKRRSRVKLLEVSSDDEDVFLPATESTGNRIQKFTQVDDETLGCSVADNGGDQAHIESKTICAQK